MPPPDSSEHEKEKIERLRRAMYSRSLSDKIKDRERRPLREGEAIVGDDFVHHEEGAPALTVAPRTMGFARSALWWVLGGAILFFLATVGFFVYYFLLGAGSANASPSNIDIVMSGPPQIQSGEPTELQIVVRNRNKTTLQLADLLITYPEGTRSPTDFKTELPNQRISLGEIEPGGQRQGTVSAVFAGNEGRPADVKAELEYRIAGSNSVFVASSNYNVIFATSPLTLSVDSNAETTSGQPVELTVTITSNSSGPINDVLVQAQYPFGFKFTSAVPAAATQNNFWQIGTLNPGEKKTIVVRGTLSGEQGDQRVFQFTTGTRSDPNTKSVQTKLADNVFRVSISKPFLGLSVAVGGASGKNIVVSPGQNVLVSVAWQNNLPTAITDAVIAARITGLSIDGATVHSADGFYRSSDGIMLWDKTTTGGALANLAPNARGTVAFNFQMPSTADLQGIVSPHLDISVNAAGKRVSEIGVPENLQSTVSQRLAVASDLELTAQGLYYANPFGSTGPMPPKAGTETTYGIVFTVTNSTNAISGARMTATLPPYVRWIGIYSPSSEKVYFKRNGQVIPEDSPCKDFVEDVCWAIGDVAPSVGLNGTAPRQAAIAIGFTPSTSQIGQEPSLLQQIRFQATDAATRASVNKSVKDVTTNINGDPGFSAANATVVK